MDEKIVKFDTSLTSIHINDSMDFSNFFDHPYKRIDKDNVGILLSLGPQQISHRTFKNTPVYLWFVIVDGTIHAIWHSSKDISILSLGWLHLLEEE